MDYKTSLTHLRNAEQLLQEQGNVSLQFRRNLYNGIGRCHTALGNPIAVSHISYYVVTSFFIFSCIEGYRSACIRDWSWFTVCRLLCRYGNCACNTALDWDVNFNCFLYVLGIQGLCKLWESRRMFFQGNRITLTAAWKLLINFIIKKTCLSYKWIEKMHVHVCTCVIFVLVLLKLWPR